MRFYKGCHEACDTCAYRLIAYAFTIGLGWTCIMGETTETRFITGGQWLDWFSILLWTNSALDDWRVIEIKHSTRPSEAQCLCANSSDIHNT